MEQHDKIIALLPPLPKKKLWEVTIAICVMLLLVFATWATGLYAFMGFPGLVKAGEVQTMISNQTQDVKQEVGKIKQQTQETNAKVDALTGALNAVLAELFAKKIRESVRQRCKTPNENYSERATINDQIYNDQREYRKYSETKSDYPLPACGEV